MDYLDSQNTSFTWQREINASQWETVKDGTAEVKISSFYLQTNLTVVNVTEYYSGNYRVVYNNSVGGNTQLFQLSVAGKFYLHELISICYTANSSKMY